MDIKIFDFKVMGDERGALIALEENKDIPFEIKRIYYTYDTDVNARRGCHAHRELKQILICVSGSCRILIDDGLEKEEVLLDSPGKGLFLGSMYWREIHDFSPDCVLLVIANKHYDESDYIRNYERFLEECGQNTQLAN